MSKVRLLFVLTVLSFLLIFSAVFCYATPYSVYGIVHTGMHSLPYAFVSLTDKEQGDVAIDFSNDYGGYRCDFLSQNDYVGNTMILHSYGEDLVGVEYQGGLIYTADVCERESLFVSPVQYGLSDYAFSVEPIRLEENGIYSSYGDIYFMPPIGDQETIINQVYVEVCFDPEQLQCQEIIPLPPLNDYFDFGIEFG